MADRYLIENREAAVGVQMLHVRQRWGGCGVTGANAGRVLLGRPKYALPGWGEAESRRAADTATGDLAEIAAWVLGTAVTWVASTGSRAAG
jgi:hypothetical protein